jgi:hypothetical protein
MKEVNFDSKILPFKNTNGTTLNLKWC